MSREETLLSVLHDACSRARIYQRTREEHVLETMIDCMEITVKALASPEFLAELQRNSKAELIHELVHLSPSAKT